MQGLSNLVNIAPVRIKLHWPDRWSPCCGTEVDTLPLELYQCVSCHQVSLGRTEYVEGKVYPIYATESRPHTR